MGKKVLIVDDSAPLRHQVISSLSKGGFRVLEAADGFAGLKLIQENPDLSLIISDLNMPKMSGIDLLVALKNDEKLASIPMIMLTTEGSVELIEKARGIGAKAWIMKPFKPDMLLAATRKIAGS